MSRQSFCLTVNYYSKSVAAVAERLGACTSEWDSSSVTLLPRDLLNTFRILDSSKRNFLCVSWLYIYFFLFVYGLYGWLVLWCTFACVSLSWDSYLLLSLVFLVSWIHCFLLYFKVTSFPPVSSCFLSLSFFCVSRPRDCPKIFLMCFTSVFQLAY